MIVSINKSILLLLNELKSQIAIEWKERGEILSKLWKAYFKEITGEVQTISKFNGFEVFQEY